MCFQNLPIEFDQQGRPFLKEGAPDPYSYQAKGIDRSKVEELLARNGHIKDVNIDPVTRVAGALAFHAVVDLDSRQVHEANSIATLFRGYEVILKGRDPRDAMYISSRVCGVCGGVHSVASSLAIEMAFGIAPPPMGIVMRNLQLSLDFMLDNPLHIFLLAGPDYSESVVANTNPTLWEKAKKAKTKYEQIHDFKTIGEIMTGLNPLTGTLYLQGLQATRPPREAYALLHGKYPHPQTTVPGGLATTVSMKELNETHNRIIRVIDFAKKSIAIWEDITDFFYEADPKYRQVGARPKNLIDSGMWDDPYAYDATYKNAPEWGDKRWATPGVILDGELVTTNLHHINMGLEEFVEHSYYESWENESVRHQTDPAGNPISPNHPWNKETKPDVGHKRSWKDRYTWATSPRWDRRAVEAGTYSRMWTTAAAGKAPSTRFTEATGHSMKLHAPRGILPAMEFEWEIPEDWNAFERNRNRCYHLLWCGLAAYESIHRAYELMKEGETRTSTPYEVPKDHRIGVGFWGAGRGWLTHHLEMDKGALINYQIITPSTFNASPKDPFGNAGPYEEAVLSTPILEEFDKPEDFTGIDIFRAIRSFDPCMPCTTHVHTDEHTVTREVNTCGCGIE